VLAHREEVTMQVMIWFLVYLLLILALTYWRDRHDVTRTKKHRRTDGTRVSGASRRQKVMRRSVRGALQHSHRTS
jgi:hypothetical protein